METNNTLFKADFDFIQKIKPESHDAHAFTSEYSYLSYAALYQFASGYCKGNKVLDAACGLGFGSYFLSHTASSVTGLEIVASNIDYAKKKYNKDNLNFVVADATNTDFTDNTFDVIVSIETFEHIPPQLAETFLTELKRILAPGGTLIISTPNTDVYSQITKTPDHVNELGVDDFYKLLSSQFSNCIPYYQRKGALNTSGNYFAAVKKDKLGLRKLLPTGIRNLVRKIAAPQMHKDPRDILQEVQVQKAVDKDDVKDAVFQIWEAKKES